CAPGHDCREQLHQPSHAVDRVPKDDRLEKVCRAAGKNESPEQPENPRKGDVAAAEDKIANHDRDRRVGAPDRGVRKDMQPSFCVAPPAAVPPGRKGLSVEQPLEKIEHRLFSRESCGSPVIGGRKAGEGSSTSRRGSDEKRNRTAPIMAANRLSGNALMQE